MAKPTSKAHLTLPPQQQRALEKIKLEMFLSQQAAFCAAVALRHQQTHLAFVATGAAEVAHALSSSSVSTTDQAVAAYAEQELRKFVDRLRLSKATEEALRTLTPQLMLTVTDNFGADDSGADKDGSTTNADGAEDAVVMARIARIREDPSNGDTSTISASVRQRVNKAVSEAQSGPKLLEEPKKGNIPPPPFATNVAETEQEIADLLERFVTENGLGHAVELRLKELPPRCLKFVIGKPGSSTFSVKSSFSDANAEVLTRIERSSTLADPMGGEYPAALGREAKEVEAEIRTQIGLRSHTIEFAQTIVNFASRHRLDKEVEWSLLMLNSTQARAIMEDRSLFKASDDKTKKQEIVFSKVNFVDRLAHSLIKKFRKAKTKASATAAIVKDKEQKRPPDREPSHSRDASKKPPHRERSHSRDASKKRRSRSKSTNRRRSHSRDASKKRRCSTKRRRGKANRKQGRKITSSSTSSGTRSQSTKSRYRRDTKRKATNKALDKEARRKKKRKGSAENKNKNRTKTKARRKGSRSTCSSTSVVSSKLNAVGVEEDSAKHQEPSAPMAPPASEFSQLLTWISKECNQYMLADIERLFTKYKRHEVELFLNICKRYKVTPTFIASEDDSSLATAASGSAAKDVSALDAIISDMPIAISNCAAMDGAVFEAVSVGGKKEDGDQKVREWLSGLDNHRGALLAYFETIQREFDSDFTQISAARLLAPKGQGLLANIDPSFFEVLGVKSAGHKLLLAKGIMGIQSESATDKAEVGAAVAAKNEEATPEDAAKEEEKTESDQDEKADEELRAALVEAVAEGLGEVDAVEVAGIMLQKALNLPPKDWPSIWADSGRSDDKVLLQLLQAPMVAPFEVGFNSKFVAELVRSSEVAPDVLETTLQAMIGQIEELVRVNATAWHTISYTFAWLFPKTTATSWGWSSSGWTWDRWWCLVDKVLNAAGDRYRAFDILVLILRVLEDKSSVAIKNQQVWQEHDRMRQLRKLLAQLLDMEELSIPSLDSLL